MHTQALPKGHFDVHDYEQDPEKFAAYLAPTAEGQNIEMKHNGPGYRACPTFVSEYGGIRWAPQERKDENRQGSWGYGKDVKDLEDFKARFKGLTDALLDNDRMMGLCYTQLTDIEQEQNGLYYYDRSPKFDAEWMHAVMSRKAAIED